MTKIDERTFEKFRRLGICSVPHTNPLNNHFLRVEQKKLIGDHSYKMIGEHSYKIKD